MAEAVRLTGNIEPGAVTQFAVLDALLEGMYSTGLAVRDAHAFGDTGIGCCEGLGGEVVVIDGEFFECTADGPPRRMTADEGLPFVDLCAIGRSLGDTVRDLDGDALDGAISDLLVSRNLFHAVRLDGVFSRLRTRVTRRQEPPYRPLAEVAAEQIETDSRDVRGTVVGFWMPRIYQGVTVAGLHLHFLSEDRRLGGHVLDIDVGDAVLRISAYARFALELPLDDEFLARELTHDQDRRIASIEGGASVSENR